jgi:aminoglycoside phosphotransferase (APT) family kinase protein
VISPARVLDTGFGSVALETAGGVIFRVARTADTATGHSREMQLLPALRQATTVAVPAPEWRVEPGHEQLPFGAIGYRRLPGTVLSPGRQTDRIAADVGGFLASLHSFPVAEAERVGVPRERTWRERAAALQAEVLPALHALVTDEEHRLLERWTDEVAGDRELDEFGSALCHRDLWFENLLVDGEPLRVVGVLDWEAACIGDPAQDLATQFHLGEAFAESVIGAYCPPEPGFRRRVGRFWELRELGGLQWALDQKDDAELADSLAKLRAGPILGSRELGTR